MEERPQHVQLFEPVDLACPSRAKTCGEGEVRQQCRRFLSVCYRLLCELEHPRRCHAVMADCRRPADSDRLGMHSCQPTGSYMRPCAAVAVTRTGRPKTRCAGRDGCVLHGALWSRPGRCAALRRRHIPCSLEISDTGRTRRSTKTNRLATCVANLLFYMAPRPGLEPGTYGLTGLRLGVP